MKESTSNYGLELIFAAQTNLTAQNKSNLHLMDLFLNENSSIKRQFSFSNQWNSDNSFKSLTIKEKELIKLMMIDVKRVPKDYSNGSLRLNITNFGYYTTTLNLSYEQLFVIINKLIQLNYIKFIDDCIEVGKYFRSELLNDWIVEVLYIQVELDDVLNDFIGDLWQQNLSKNT